MSDEQYLYGLTQLEQRAKESTQAHEIVSEIVNFGITQRQMLMVIKRLALNLENNDHMRSIAKMADECLEDDPENTIIEGSD